jgi:pimeloyl-ACP methyl ester carboxylesterase
MPMVQAGAVRLEYFERGEGPHTFVLAHGYRSSGRIWDPVQHHLAERSYRSIAVSMRAAGASDVTERDKDYSAFNFAKDLTHAVDGIGLERFVLVGHSLGAAVVTNYVRDHPERVEALVLLSGGALFPPAQMTPEARATWLAMIEGYPATIDRAYWESEHAGLSAETRQASWEDWQRVPKARLRGVMTEIQDLEPVVRNMPVPTLVCFGDRDRTVPPWSSALCYLALPEDERHLHVFHGMDHSPNAVNPERFTALLARFAEGQVWGSAGK